ncbi:MAG: DUF1501 domain-containing protein [Verrucomicrobiota bacterium]
MKKSPKKFEIHTPTKIDRRSFLTRSGTAGLGISGLAATLANMKLVSEATASSSGMDMSKYKALICFFLGGGCDMNNGLIPIGNHPQRASYDNDRGFAAIPEADISTAGTELNVTDVNGTAPPGGGNVYGLHPELQNLASRFNSGQAAFIANCGTLAVPLAEGISLEDYQAAIKPIQLFSHSDQVNEWFSSIPQNPFISGWAGRIAQLFQTAPYANAPASINEHSLSSMLMTAAGSTDLLVAPGGAIPQYAVNRTGAINFAGYGSDYANALSGGQYDTGATGDRFRAFEGTVNYTHDHILEQGFNGIVKSARENEATIGAATGVADAITTPSANYDPQDRQLDDIFLTVYNTRTSSNVTDTTGLPNDMEELLMICKLIAGRECLGNTHQVFFFNLGGFDNHANLLAAQAPLLEQVDMMIEAFIQCMDAIDAAQANFDKNMATLFEASDFNRTWTPNTSGTDHAWGTHTFCVGGAVEDAIGAGTPKKIHGRFPVLEVDGPNDVPGNNNRGRWIPQISTDQYYARLASWFGVASADMETIFPNLANGFTDPLTHPDLNFLPLS